MPEHTTPLAPDQPEQHVYEPPHDVHDYATATDAYWYTKPGDECFRFPRVMATVRKDRKTFLISSRGCEGMDAGESMRIANYLADAVRWATGEIEKLNTAKEVSNG